MQAETAPPAPVGQPPLIVQQAAEPLTIQRVLYKPIVEQFQPGDLMYGLAMARADTGTEVIKKLEALSETGQQSAAVILDELNNYFLGTETANDEFGDDRSPYGQTQRGYQPSAQISDQALRFKAWLEQHPRYSPLLRQMRGLPLADRARVWARIKETCKAGLEYTAGEGRGHIYFILDDLDMTAVVKKLRYNKGGDAAFNPKLKVDPKTRASVKDITPAELRYLYRHRKDATMMSNVSFWLGGSQVKPPWELAPALWKHYKPYSEMNAFQKLFNRGKRSSRQ